MSGDPLMDDIDQSWCHGCNGEGITDCVACDECQGTGKRVVIDPPADLVMVVDRSNTAHVLLPADERPVFRPTLCGSEMYDLAALHDLLDTLAAPWSLLMDRHYRAWPPWPCQTCVARQIGRGERPSRCPYCGSVGPGRRRSNTTKELCPDPWHEFWEQPEFGRAENSPPGASMKGSHDR